MGTNPRDIKLDDEFSALNRELTDAEYSMLEGSIAVDGIREPLVVWDEQCILIDGHNRRDVCINLNCDIPDDKIERKSFASREEALLWAIKYQCGRRNLTTAEMSELRGKRYRNEKKAAHRPEKGGQNVHLNEAPEKTAERLAAEYGVSERTIRRDEEFADKLAAMPNEKRQSILRGEGPTKKQILEKPKPMPAAVGMAASRKAIAALAAIPVDDTERMQALAAVAAWISENE